MLLRLGIVIVVFACALLGPGLAHAAGGAYTFDGGTPQEQKTVESALDASAFDWNLVPAQITVHIVRRHDSEAVRGQIWLDADLLDAGRFAWGTVQHEYAHQVDFFLLDDAKRAQLETSLGGVDWCYGVAGLPHASYGCERFASTLAWAYWPSRDNALRPASTRDEAGSMPPASFRSLVGSLLGAPIPFLFLRTR